ncbi:MULTISPECIES: hypothetical protein [Corallincola]|uniref:Uncharacterized protein n=3 Tax=Corallincola TaxID=1775176 RepID=A0A368NH66_9GAMM|nr:MULTISPECIES: hypothetical protein [Corallincola]RCU48731.1 hypothetical protein DU002_13115 [Corallincola holothuriorum]TAA42628.1 hypothetical protein EXY25_15170 [Corallincola spongiicola]TCI01725.1 hypothetical protein EZV61_17290 [Corallincola luteus]
MRVVFILLFVLHLSGCVGLAVGSYGTFENKKEDFTVSSERNKFDFGARKQAYTQEQLIELWGNPDDSYTEGKCTVLSYHDGYNWSGVGAFVFIIPIPLAVPSGNNETKLYFINNQSVAATTEYGEVIGMFGYMCGSNECGFNAGPVDSDKARKVSVDWCS